MSTFASPGPITASLTTAGARVRVVASERSDTVVGVEPINSASKSDVKVAEHTTVDFSAGELSVKTTKSGDRTGSVAITIGHIAGTATIEGGAAGVRIDEVTDVLKYQGTTGKIRIGHAVSDIELGGSNGSFDIDHAEGSVIAKAANCPIRIGRITCGQAELTNASGGIEIGITEDTAAWVDANSTNGTVRNSLPAQDNPDQSDNQVKIYARTRFDDIVIHHAAV